MKLKTLFLFAIVFLFTQTVFSQIDHRNYIKFSLTVDKLEWRKDEKIVAKLSIENISNSPVKLEIGPKFYLVKEGIDESDLAVVGYSSYYSVVRVNTPINNGKTFVVSDEDKRDFFATLSLKAGEVRTVEMDLSRLAWGQSNLSGRPYSVWFKGVPKGKYKLYFAKRTGQIEEVKYQDYVVHVEKQIESNKVSVILIDGQNKD